jgi:hypothetical protein
MGLPGDDLDSAKRRFAADRVLGPAAGVDRRVNELFAGIAAC